MARKAKTDEPQYHWVTEDKYSHRCSVCGGRADVISLEGDELCIKDLRERRKIVTLGEIVRKNELSL